jgi:hypothetical protein
MPHTHIRRVPLPSARTGRPRRHGPKLDTGNPQTWPENPQRSTAVRIQATAWQNSSRLKRKLSRSHALPYEVGSTDRLALREPPHHHPVIVANPQGQSCVEHTSIQVYVVYLLVARLFGVENRRARVSYHHAVFVQSHGLIKAPEDDRRGNAFYRLDVHPFPQHLSSSEATGLPASPPAARSFSTAEPL